MAAKDYYAVLELPREATDEDIKKAYRKMAIKWHPDKNPENKEEATLKFKEVAEAYEVLSDPAKRQMFDQGVDPNDQTADANDDSTFAAHDPFEIFHAFFGGGDPFEGLFSNACLFGSGFKSGGRRKGRRTGSRSGELASIFGDGFFDDGDDDDDNDFFGLGSMMFMSSSSTSGGHRLGQTVTTTTTTTTTNGRGVTRKVPCIKLVTQITNRDGTTSETVEETTRGPKRQKKTTTRSRPIAASPEAGPLAITAGNAKAKHSGRQPNSQVTSGPGLQDPHKAKKPRLHQKHH